MDDSKQSKGKEEQDGNDEGEDEMNDTAASASHKDTSTKKSEMSEKQNPDKSSHSPPFAPVVETDDPEAAIPTHLERSSNVQISSSSRDDEHRTPGAVHVDGIQTGRNNNHLNTITRRQYSSTAESSSPNVVLNAELVVEIDGSIRERTRGQDGEGSDEEDQKVVTVQAERMASPIRILLRSRRNRCILALLCLLLVVVILWVVFSGDDSVIVVDEEGNILDVGESDEFDCLVYGEDC